MWPFNLFRKKPQVVGVGWAKTGTTTLGACFEELGYRHCGQRLDLVPALQRGDKQEIRQQAIGYESFEDWPWILLFRDFDRWFPGCKFVLTTRDSNHWLRSYRNLLERSIAGDGIDETRSFLYGLDFPDVSDEELVERYERHNREVQDYFASRPDQLLVVNWEEGDGWEKLCSFLEEPVPAKPFPHANKGDY